MNRLKLKIMPVAVLLILGVIMLGATELLPFLSFRYRGEALVALVLILLGFLICGIASAQFTMAKTTADPTDPTKTTKLVTTGIYRISRNPTYIGFFLLLLGWAAMLSNVAAIILSFLFLPYMAQFQVRPEERIMEEKFGDEYIDYKARTRRWI